MLRNHLTLAAAILLLTLFVSSCQPKEKTVADTFVEYGLMTEGEYVRFAGQYDVAVQDDPRMINLWIMMNKNPGPRRYYSFPPTGKEAEEAKIEAHRMVEGMHLLGLVNEKEETALRKDIDNQRVISRLQVLNWPYSHREFEKKAGPKTLHRIAQDWESLGMIEAGQKARLEDLIKQDSREAAHRLPEFLTHIVIFQEGEWNLYHENEFQNILDSLLKLVPEAKIGSFSYRIDTVPYDSFMYPPTRLELPVELVLNGLRYSVTIGASFPPRNSSNPDPAPGRFPLSEYDLCDLLNQFLRETGSEDRIVTIHPNLSVLEPDPTSKIRFTRLSREQFEKGLESYEVPWWVDEFVYEEALSRKEVDTHLKSLQNWGLLGNLSPSEIQKISHDAFLKPVHEPMGILYAVPDLVMSAQLPWQKGKNPFPELFRNLERISNGAFAPEQIDFTPVGNVGTAWRIDFQHHGKAYQDTLRFIFDSSLDFEFVSIANEALKDRGDKRRFEYFDYVGDFISYIFASENQFQQLIDQGFVEDPNGFE